MTLDAASVDVSLDDGSTTGRFARALDLDDPEVLAASRTPGTGVHRAMGRSHLDADERRARQLARVVLVVHDHASALDAIRTALALAGLDVEAAPTADAALLRLRSRFRPRPAVVVVDYVLGLARGTDVLRAMQLDQRAVVVSGHEDTARVAREAARWRAPFFAAPLAPDVMDALVSCVLSLLDDTSSESP